MTKTERLMKAFENEKVDRVPVGFWFHLPEDMELMHILIISIVVMWIW